MTMSKKHYKAIAAILKSYQAPKFLCDALAAEFNTDNPRFSYDKFMEACGYP